MLFMYFILLDVLAGETSSTSLEALVRLELSRFSTKQVAKKRVEGFFGFILHIRLKNKYLEWIMPYIKGASGKLF